MGELAGPALRRALDNPPSVDARLRVQVLLRKLADKGLSAEELRALRAVQVLEQTGNADARRVLDETGTRDPPHRLGERQSFPRSRLRLAESLEEAGELSGIDLYPAAAQQLQPRRARQELFDLARGQGLAIQH